MCIYIYIYIHTAILAQAILAQVTIITTPPAEKGVGKTTCSPKRQFTTSPRPGIISPLPWPSATSSSPSASSLPPAASSPSSPGSDLRVSATPSLQTSTSTTTPPSTIPCSEVNHNDHGDDTSGARSRVLAVSTCAPDHPHRR